MLLAKAVFNAQAAHSDRARFYTVNTETETKRPELIVLCEPFGFKNRE